MDPTPYTLEAIGAEEGGKLTEELQAVLAKYDAEMGVTSSITMFKRVYPSALSREDVAKGPEEDDGRADTATS